MGKIFCIERIEWAASDATFGSFWLLYIMAKFIKKEINEQINFLIQTLQSAMRSSSTAPNWFRDLFVS